MVKAFIIWDDREYAAGNRVEAERTVTLSLDGQTVELDLSASSWAQLQADLAPWFKVGTATTTGSGKRPPAGVHGGANMAGRRYYAGLRAWADSVGRTAEYRRHPWPARPDEQAYKYPAALRADYEKHRAREANAARGTGQSGTPGR